MKRLLFYIILISLNLNLNAQVVYPIRSNTVLRPPTPYSLSGFVSEAGKMTLNIYVDDVNLDQYAVKFRVHIEGNGIKLSTRPDFYQPAYYLDGGMTHSLSGFELENLMNPNNLVFEGYSRNQYKKTGRLPEGVYRIWIDVIDYYRNVKVSMSPPSIAMIYLAKAPRLSFPADKTEIDPGVMPSIRFSWFSILPADPLADINYRFKLYEIRPEGRSPYEIVRVMQPIFQSEMDQSFFTYDLGMPPLISGQWYAWKVEAYDSENRVLFQNDGHSDVLTFRYGKTCQLPELRITSVNNHDVSLCWQADMNTNNYVLAYKKTKADDWTEKETDLNQIKINGLDDNTGYQIKIKGFCKDGETDFSRNQECKTPREINYACGKKGNSFDLTNDAPLSSLGRFDEFKAADFIVEVEEVEGDNGNFSGKGYALVPYLGFIKFRVEFENIFVNSDSRMISGEIKFIYDEATGLVVGGNNGVEDDNDEAGGVDIIEELNKISNQVIKSDKEITGVVVNGSDVLISYEDGSTKRIKIEEGKKVAVVGGSETGNAYVVNSSSGQVFKTPKKVSGGGKGASSVGTASQTGEYGCSVEFLQAKNQRFGFDRVGDGKTKANSYFKTTKSGVKVAWKSLESGASDFADLKLTGTCLVDSLRFIRNSGLLTPSVPKSEGLQVLLTGLTEGEEDLLTVATVKTEVIGDSTSREILTEVGALGLVSYDKISRDVVLVPVNGAQCPNVATSIAQELNKIYSAAVVDWTVTIEKNLDVEKIKGHNFEGSGTNTFSKYTGDMRSVIKKFKREREFNRHTLYLFFIDDRSVSKSGFMPLASEFGFIFNFGSDPKLIAHELGHGKEFNLRHTFSDKAQHYFPERSTQNLMDYADGVELWKYQWDLIHNPEKILFSWAQDEKEGAYRREACRKYFDKPLSELQKQSVTIDGINYKVPKSTSEECAEFTTPIEYWVSIDNQAKSMGNEFDEEGNDKYYSARIELNSPMTIEGLNISGTGEGRELFGIFTDVSFNEAIGNSTTYHTACENWKGLHFSETTQIDFVHEDNVELLANALTNGGELDFSIIHETNTKTLYYIDYPDDNQKIYYNAEEIKFYHWGYASSFYFNFNDANKALAFAFTALNRDGVVVPMTSNLEVAPWNAKAFYDGWVSALNHGNWASEANQDVDVYSPKSISSDYLVDGFGMTDAVEMVLWVAPGTAAAKQITLKIGSQILLAAYIDWQLQIFLAMLDDKTFEEAIALVRYEDVLWTGLTAPISDFKTKAGLACVRAAVNEIEENKEVSYNTAFACLSEVLQEGVIHGLFAAKNSPYNITLANIFSGKTRSRIITRLKSIGLSQDDAYAFMDMLPAIVTSKLIDNEKKKK